MKNTAHSDADLCLL